MNYDCCGPRSSHSCSTYTTVSVATDVRFQLRKADAHNQIYCAEMPLPVVLNVYDLSEQSKQFAETFSIGGGLYHTGVEVDGTEYSYGRTDDGSCGIELITPRSHEQHIFRDAIPLGATERTTADIKAWIDAVGNDWNGEDYNIVRKNCISFSKAFVEFLGADPIPEHVTAVTTQAQQWATSAQQVFTRLGCPNAISQLENFFEGSRVGTAKGHEPE